MASYNSKITGLDGLAVQSGIYIGDPSTNTKIINSSGAFVGSLVVSGTLTVNGVIIGSAPNRISGLSTIVNGAGTLTLPSSTDTLVGKATTDVLTNKTLTAPVISTISNTGTLTLPTSTDTLVGKNTTDVLTNKTLTAPVISTISNTGTLTLPTSTDTLVGKNTTDILTNKTISGGSNTLSNIADSSLSTISTAGKVANSATTAVSSNAINTIVLRDSSGNFSAGTITATLTGNATNVSGVVAIANGGTNSSTGLNNNRVIQSTGGKIQEAAAITASRALVSNSLGIPVHSATTAAELAFVSGVTSALQTQINSISALSAADFVQNVGLSTAVSSSALVITMKYKDGSSLSASQIASINFRSTTLTTGTFSNVTATSNVTLTVPSSATLGSQNSVEDYAYIYAINNAGTIELAVTGGQYVPNSDILTTTTISSGATSANTIYSGTGRSNVAVRLIGRLRYTQTTAGTWASAGTELQLVQNMSNNPFMEKGTFTALFNGGAGSGGSGNSFTVNFFRVGKNVTLTFPDMSGITAGATNATFSTAANTVPTRLLPINTLNMLAVGKVNSAFQNNPSQIQVTTGGVISISRDVSGGTTYTSAQTNNGTPGCCISYQIS
jgi:hypothetical protein